MIQIVEEKFKNKNVYRKIVTDDEGNVTYEKCVDVYFHKISYKNKEYYLLFDEDMKLIEDAFFYLNNTKEDASPNTRKTIAIALRLFYTFVFLFDLDVRNLIRRDIDNYIRFLRGITISKDSIRARTVRSNATVNEYLGILRGFFYSSDITCNALTDTRSAIVTMDMEDTSIQVISNKYYVSLPESSVGKNEVPRYISPDEFRRIYQVILCHEDDQSLLIVHLLYGYGLRIGECLGITVEDIKEVRRNGKLIPVIILRNRASDRMCQHCKGLRHVNNPEIYKTKEYADDKHEIVISYELYDRLLEFIDETHAQYIDPNHPKYTKKAAQRYLQGTADVVERISPAGQNHYVFLNSLGRPLQQTWDVILASYMIEAGVAIDRRIGEDSLSHRFRHGFAMFHAKYKKPHTGIVELQKMLRHKSIQSTQIYYTVTIEDQFEMIEGYQEELFKAIPELEAGIRVLTDEEKNL